jgi:acetyl esterase/lipase
MVAFWRLLTSLSFVLTSHTVIRPRKGWGRLVLFIPKLLTGSFILFCGFMGFAGTISGWFFSKDIWSVILGLGAAAIASRHVYRIVHRSLEVGDQIAGGRTRQPGNLPKMMLPYPWVGIWKEAPEPAWQKDVAIGQNLKTGNTILADLWYPSDQANRSSLGIIYLHGSGWHYADKDFGTRHFFRHLTQQGHVIADLAYTLAPEADLFGMVADVKHAICWMKGQAQELGTNPQRTILMGGSAGGHLALLAAYTPNHPRLDPADVHEDTSVHGVISYYGPPDLWAQFDRFRELPGLTGENKLERTFMTTLEARFGFEVIPVHSLLPNFLGGTPEDIPELYILGSPIKQIGRYCPATLLLQGAHDFSGVAPEVRKLYLALKELGCPVFLLELPDTEHGFDLYKPKWSPAAQAATYVTERFLASLI